jgi:type IV pilus assembly protein PilA
MFRRFHEMKERGESGFTLIELLVVILIIAILAAIAIPVFLAQREKGWIAQMESALKNGATAAESYATDTTGGNGSYTGLTSTKLTDQGWKYAASVNAITVNVSTTGNKYCIQVGHSQYAGALEPMGISSDTTVPTAGTCTAGVLTAS